MSTRSACGGSRPSIPAARLSQGAHRCSLLCTSDTFGDKLGLRRYVVEMDDGAGGPFEEIGWGETTLNCAVEVVDLLVCPMPDSFCLFTS